MQVKCISGVIIDASTTAKAGDTLDIAESLARTLIAQGIAYSLESAIVKPRDTAIAELVDTDGTLAANSDAFIPSQKAVKTYVDRAAGAADTPPATPNAIDDEFAGNSLNGKWAWVNQSDASASVANGALRLSSATGDRVWSLLLQSAPAAPWTIAAKFRMQGALADFTSAGIAVRNSASGAHANVGLYFKSTDPGGGGIELQEYSDLTTYVADIAIARFGFIHPGIYMKLVNDGTNLNSFYSLDGITYTQVAQTAIATVLGAVNQFGLSVWSINGGGSSFDLIVDWFRRLA
jgi:hypothetical protein